MIKSYLFIERLRQALASLQDSPAAIPFKRALLLVAMLSVISGSAFAEDFTYTNNGVTLKYASTGETTCKLVGYEGQPRSVEIPSRVNSSTKFYSVTEIGKDAFAGCSSLASVTIPESVTSIGGGHSITALL